MTNSRLLPEEGVDERGLAGAGAADNAHLLPGQHEEGEVAQHGRLPGRVVQAHAPELQPARLGPRRRRLLARLRLQRRLRLDLRVLLDAAGNALVLFIKLSFYKVPGRRCPKKYR